MPPVTFIESTVADGTLVLPMPRRARAGDLLIGVVLTTDTAELELPDGWSELARVSAPTTAHAAVWLVRHRVVDPEPATHQLGVSAGTAWAAALLYRGLAEGAAVSAVADDQASSTSHKAPDANANTYSDLLLEVWASFSTTAWTAPGNLRERVNAECSDPAVDAHLLIADALREATGNLAGSTATSAAGTVAIACTFVLAAAPPPQAIAIDRPTPGAIGIREV